MGFTKWFFKNGFGSIGSTARTWAKMYHDTAKAGDDINREEVFMHIIISYTFANKKFRQYHHTDYTLLEDKSEGCLAMLIWVLICDVPPNVKAILSDKKTFQLSSEVVYQSVMDVASEGIIMTPSEFTSKAMDYLDYRDNVSRVLVTNKDVYNPKFKTAIISRIYGVKDIYEDLIFVSAKERYENLIEKNNPDDFVIWSIEMNSNKYVYVHLCNDYKFKYNMNSGIKQLGGKVKLNNIDD